MCSTEHDPVLKIKSKKVNDLVGEYKILKEMIFQRLLVSCIKQLY